MRLWELVDTGLDCFEPIDPMGHMDMAVMKKKYWDRIGVIGNIDCVSILVDKPLEAVRKETTKCIFGSSIGGGHIILSSNSIHAGINPENYAYFLECVDELGRYPIDTVKLYNIINN